MSQDRDFLKNLLEKSSDNLNKYFGTEINVTMKQDDSLVTDADLASEKLIINEIKAKYPKDTILAEEGGLSSVKREVGSHIWIIDPLDGTTNFAHRNPYFCVSIARGRFNESGLIDVVLGGVVHPPSGTSFVAELGSGATAGEQKIAISRKVPLEKVYVATGLTYHKERHLIEKDTSYMLDVARTCHSLRINGACALDIAYTSAGIYDVFFEYGIKAWDIAAGALLIKEAGGAVYSLNRQGYSDFQPESNGIICGETDAVEGVLKALNIQKIDV